MSVTPSELSLAASLFEQVSGLTAVPSDGVYADCLISLAFSHLRSGIRVSAPDEGLQKCADAIEACAWLSDTVRQHIARTLRGVAAGSIPSTLAQEIIEAATQRSSHQLVINCARAGGSDGMETVAELLAEALGNVRH